MANPLDGLFFMPVEVNDEVIADRLQSAIRFVGDVVGEVVNGRILITLGASRAYYSLVDVDANDNVGPIAMTFTGPVPADSGQGLWQINARIEVFTTGTTGTLTLTVEDTGASDQVVITKSITSTGISSITAPMRATDGILQYTISGITTPGTLAARVSIYATYLGPIA